MSYRVARSASVDTIPRESYLSRWSRENTPVDSHDTYRNRVRRSFTPVREIGAFQTISDERRPLSAYRARTPLAMVTVPFHTNVNYYTENEPFRKYDVFQLRTWSYPIWKYIYRDTNSARPYSYTRNYGTTTHYTPHAVSPEARLMTTRRGYSGYNYVAAENSFDISSRPRSRENYQFWRSHVSASPWYWSYYGNSGLRHFNAYRPRVYTSRVSTYWWPRY